MPTFQTISSALVAVSIFASATSPALAQPSVPPGGPRPAPAPEITPPPTGGSRTTPGVTPPPAGEPRPAPAQQRGTRLSAIDRQFIIDAAHGGVAEVTLGQLALQRANSPEIKQFAQRMIQEHTQANRELIQIAASKGFTPPTSPGPRYEAVRQQMLQLSGADFDRAYMTEAGLNGHLESAAIYQRQIALGQDADLKAFAAKTLPIVQQHLRMANTMKQTRK